jgi:ATP-binding cassette subfamily C (CFTR/MRP) protein 4
MSNDVNRFDHSVIFFVYLWFGPLETLVVSYLMWREIGFAAVIGVATIVLVIPLQGMFLEEIIIMKVEIAVCKCTYGSFNNMTQACMKLSL